jgi:hypothetical protein
MPEARIAICERPPIRDSMTAGRVFAAFWRCVWASGGKIVALPRLA